MACCQHKQSGLRISTNSPLVDVPSLTPAATAAAAIQVDAAGWFDLTADARCGQRRFSSSNPTGQQANGRRASMTTQQQQQQQQQVLQTVQAPPHGRASTCSSPKSAQQAANQLRGLQRTPLPLILARMKVLLERLNMLTDEGTCPSAAAQATATSQRPPSAPAAAAQSFFAPDRPTSNNSSSSNSAAGQHGWHASSANAAAFLQPSSVNRPGSALPGSRQHPAAAPLAGVRPASSGGSRAAGGMRGSDAAAGPRGGGGRMSSSGGSSGGAGGSKQGGAAAVRRAVKGLTEVSTSGGLGQSVMQASAQSVLEELDVTLGFISDFLGKLRPDTRKALATVARLENYKEDQLIYDAGEEPSHFYVILSGRIDIWSHPPGAHRPKSVVSVLRRGEAFGDQAIINGEPHGTAASPATNVTLLVVTREDFLTVLGSHFRDVAADWQHFLVTHVAPMADCDPGMVRRLCSALVSEKLTEGQQCSMQEDQVCFIQAGTFEVQLIDLQAQQAAQAALAAAVAAAFSTLPVAPIPEHLRLAPGGRPHSSSGSVRRPASAPPGAQRPPGAAAPAAAAAAGGLGPGTVSNSATRGVAQQAAGSASEAAGVAARLVMLQGDLADCPALGSEGVLASVRVKDGRLVGTQGLAKALRKQHGSCVPYKVVAKLATGGWFGGGEAIYGSGPLQSALRVVAVGPDCQVLHAHLSGLEKHGGPTLIKRLREDAAFKLTYSLGRTGVLPPMGAAVGHPEATLVAEAAAAAERSAAAAAAAAAAASPEAQWLGRSAKAGAGTLGWPVGAAAAAVSSTAASVLASPGRSPCSTVRSRPASAAPAVGERGRSAGTAVGAAARSRRATGNAPAAAAAGAGVQSSAQPACRAAATGQALRRSSSTGSEISSAWDDAHIGVLAPSAAGEDGGAASGSSAAAAGQLPSGAEEPGAPTQQAAGGDTASLLSSSLLPRAAGRAKQKRVHVPGSGVFGPGVMAALQHVKALQQAAGSAAAPAAPAVTAGTSAASRSSMQAESLSAAGAGPRMRGSIVAAASSDCSASSTAHEGGQVSCSSPKAARQSAVQGLSAVQGITGRSSILVQAAAAAPGGCGDAGGGRSNAHSDNSSNGIRPRSAAAAGRPGTAADAYWQQPEHSTTATGAALSGLLSNLFTDGLQPLVRELDCLLSHVNGPGQQQQQQNGLATATCSLPPALQQQQQQWCARPDSAYPRLQQAKGRGPDSPAGVAAAEWQGWAASDNAQCSSSNPASLGSTKAVCWGPQQQQQQQQQRGFQAPGCLQLQQQQQQQQQHQVQSEAAGVEGGVLCHKPTASLLAASVMWQRSSEAAYRPPLRQCLTPAEIAQQRSQGGEG